MLLYPERVEYYLNGPSQLSSHTLSTLMTLLLPHSNKPWSNDSRFGEGAKNSWTENKKQIPIKVLRVIEIFLSILMGRVSKTLINLYAPKKHFSGRRWHQIQTHRSLYTAIWEWCMVNDRQCYWKTHSFICIFLHRVKGALWLTAILREEVGVKARYPWTCWWEGHHSIVCYNW